MVVKMSAVARLARIACLVGTTISCALAAGGVQAAQPEVITLRSGNGSLNSPDSKIRYIARSGSFSSFTSADFAAARAGQFARIVNPYSEPGNSWVYPLPDDPAARWIAVNDKTPNSALYAYDFTVNSRGIKSARLDLVYAVDNLLGSATVPGLYLNGMPVPGTTGLTGWYNQQYSVPSLDIGPLLHPGTNTLYFYQNDSGGVAGSIFSAQLTIEPANNPPTAEAGGPYSSDEGSAIAFSGSGSDVDADTLTYSWDFGDGGTATGANATHTYVDDGSYTATLTVADSAGATATDTATVSVANVAPNVSILGAPATSPEGTSTSLSSTVTDPGSLDTHTYSWSVTKNGASFGPGGNSSSFTFVPDDNGAYVVTLKATDADGGEGVASASINVTNVAPMVDDTDLRLSSTMISENGSVELSGVFIDPGMQDPHTVIIDWGDGTSDTLSLTNKERAFSKVHQYLDDAPSGTASDPYPITATIRDESAGDSAAAVVTVSNVAPVATILGPASGALYAVNAPITFSGTIADVGSLDTHSATWSFTNAPFGAPFTQSVSGSVNASTRCVTSTFTFNQPGVYAVRLGVEDDDTGKASADTVTDGQGNVLPAFAVIYDPSAGFVTGGGWIYSPAGAMPAFPQAEGKASFGFVARYAKGASVPDGNTEFQFKAGNLNFKSVSYEWLVVSGARAQFRGEGTINGEGSYGFKLTAIDGQRTGGGGYDRFRIKIWNKLTGQTVYDNQLGSDDGASLADWTIIQGGSIVIHY